MEVVGGRSIRVGSDDLERWDAKGNIFQADILMKGPFDLERPNSARYIEEGRISRVVTSQPQGSGAQALPSFGGSPLFMPIPFNAQRPRSTR